MTNLWVRNQNRYSNSIMTMTTSTPCTPHIFILMSILLLWCPHHTSQSLLTHTNTYKYHVLATMSHSTKCKIPQVYCYNNILANRQIGVPSTCSIMVVNGKRARCFHEVSGPWQYQYLSNSIELMDNDLEWEDEPKAPPLPSAQESDKNLGQSVMPIQ